MVSMAAGRFPLFLIPAAAAVGADRLSCGKPFSAPGAGLIPAGTAQGTESIVTGMFLAADGTLDHLSRAGDIERGSVHPHGLRLYWHMLPPAWDEAGAEEGKISTARTAVYIRVDPIKADAAQKTAQGQMLVLLPKFHWLPTVGAHQMMPLHLQNSSRCVTPAGSPDRRRWRGASAAPPPQSPGPRGRSCRTTCPRSGGRTPPGRAFSAGRPPSPAAGTPP